ncbi:ABC transporter ATP-binding protein [Nocardia sp. NPDC059177]|uniref:ABC transporter ATP-binding protein n=1 Tax=Nocardia sp. NPDC059177 TaxID=3346759 RepID=UPI0036795BEB
MPEPALAVESLGYTHDRVNWLFREVSHRFEAGEVLTVLGPNGRGKTTLLRCLVGLAAPTEGRVAGAGTIGYVPQHHRTTFSYTAFDMVLMGRARHLRAAAMPGRRDRELAGAAMARVGVAELAGRDYPSLSGGERQLVLIARAIVSESPILVLDEPAAALDLRNQGQVLHLLRGLADEGRTVVLTTHHPDHAIEIADTAMLLFGGGDVRIGPVETTLTDESVGELYGVRAHTVLVDEQRPRRVIITRYEK